eukprot:CAMPEP_0183736880 /NCGR_PEP_ID=MMETSP0737-20130205/50499_1 /TAXON_ID=385413 /ORGANISM="Thalassiosira miniscula, Strain CCMP1093" /LENGTH=57 /DNA_ID=CAMNT_0025971007 /DNA_START=65 /DNA_END=234 /DNA_ORIENTATION=+
MIGELSELVGLGIDAAAVVGNIVKTKKAAEAEGITYEEMELRRKAARCREKATTAFG